MPGTDLAHTGHVTVGDTAVRAPLRSEESRFQGPGACLSYAPTRSPDEAVQVAPFGILYVEGVSEDGTASTTPITTAIALTTPTPPTPPPTLAPPPPTTTTTPTPPATSIPSYALSPYHPTPFLHIILRPFSYAYYAISGTDLRPTRPATRERARQGNHGARVTCPCTCSAARGVPPKVHSRLPRCS
eukprot:815555-Rhodomonas_salina.2